MARSKSLVDQYVQRAMVQITMSAANTLTFDQIRFGVGTFQGVGLIIQKVEFYPQFATIREIVAATDSLQVALCARDDLTSLVPTNQSVYAQVSIVGVAANVASEKMPYTVDFTAMGGLLIPPNPLYIAATSGGFVGAGVIDAIVYYKFKQLTDQESLEVLQTLLPGNV